MSRQYESVADLPKEAQQTFYDLMLVLADSKQILGLRYGEWLGAPAIEASISAVAMAQDEFGHARLFYGIVDEFVKQGWSPREENPQHYRNLECLDKQFDTWMDFVAINALVDLALTVQIEAFAESSYLPMRRMIGKITQEEKFHQQHAHGWLLRIVEESDKSKHNIEKSFKKLWEPVLCWLGRPNSEVEKVLVEAGLQSTDQDGLRNRFAELIGPIIEESNLDLPVSGDTVTGEWLVSSNLHWESWDDAFRRTHHHGPDAETFSQIETFFGHSYPVGS